MRCPSPISPGATPISGAFARALFGISSQRILPRQRSKVLDLGAGNCWLSYRLAELRHQPVAVDIFRDPRDGLRAARHYPVGFPTVEADFDGLPFANASFDLVVFNASFHYSADYARTLSEARRCLRPEGRVVILDSPVYKRSEHGEQMRAERQVFFEKQSRIPLRSAAQHRISGRTGAGRTGARVAAHMDGFTGPGTGSAGCCVRGRRGSKAAGRPRAFGSWKATTFKVMIILLHPRSTRPKNRRFPLSVLALAAVLEGKE